MPIGIAAQNLDRMRGKQVRAPYKVQEPGKASNAHAGTGIGRPWREMEFEWDALALLIKWNLGAGMVEPRAYNKATDDELLFWSAQGDRRAFDEIVVRHGSFVLSVASRLIPNFRDAEDIAQDAMVKVWHHAGRFNPKRARLRTWLYQIVVNLCIDRRRRKEPVPLPDNFDAVDPGAAADEILTSTERDAALAAAIRALPASQQAAMILVYEEGVSGAEAGRILGLSAKAIERLLARARTTLRERLLAERDKQGE